jgi:hypothetical protein
MSSETRSPSGFPPLNAREKQLALAGAFKETPPYARAKVAAELRTLVAELEAAQVEEGAVLAARARGGHLLPRG